MNRLLTAIILTLIVLIWQSCGGPKDGKPVQQQTEQQVKQDFNQVNSSALSTTRQFPNEKEVTSTKTGVSPEWILFGLMLIEGVCIGWLFVKVKKTEIKLNHGIDDRRIEIGRLDGEVNELRRALIPIIKKKNSENPPQLPIKQGDMSRCNGEVKTAEHEFERRISHNQSPKQNDDENVFLKHFKDGILEEVPEDQAFYQVTFESGKDAGRFKFVGDVKKAVKNKNSILDNVCDTIEYNQTATQIKTNKEGICIKQPDGMWKVTQKAKISFK